MSAHSFAALLLPVAQLLRNKAARWPRLLRLQPRPAAAAHLRLCQQRVAAEWRAQEHPNASRNNQCHHLQQQQQQHPARWPRLLRLQPRPAAHLRRCQQRVAAEWKAQEQLNSSRNNQRHHLQQQQQQHPVPRPSDIRTTSWAKCRSFPSRSATNSTPLSSLSRPGCASPAAVAQRWAPRFLSLRHPLTTHNSRFGQPSGRAACPS